MIAQKVFEQPDAVQFWRFLQKMDLSFEKNASTGGRPPSRATVVQRMAREHSTCKTDKSLTKANSRYIFVGCSLRLNISPRRRPMDSTKATINTSGLKKIHDTTKWLQSLTNKTNCNEKESLQRACTLIEIQLTRPC